MSTLATNAITDASGGNTATINSYTPTESNMAGRNRIINGDMRIDQRNAGAAVTINSSAYTYPVDRFAGFGESTDGVFTLQQSSTAPTGFTNSLLATVTTADASIGASQRYFVRQGIEGYNIADLGYGTAAAATVTLSFYVRSSLTGTFGGSFMNDAFSRAYPFTYTISTANTWEQKSVTIAGDTSGTWLTTNGGGIYVIFSIGAGSSRVGTAGAWQTPASPLFGATGQTNIIATNGATWQITGVQLEEGSVATPFERRFYGQELALCQRYYQKWQNESGGETTGSVGTGTVWTAINFFCVLQYFVPMRALPDGEKSSTTALTMLYNGVAKQTTNIVFSTYSRNSVEVVGTSSGMGAGQAGFVRFTGASDYIALTAEL